MKQKNLNAKIELWKEINTYANKIEELYPLFYTLLITILGIIIKIFDGNLVPVKALDEKFIILIFLPIALSAIIGYLAYNFRWVAIARMYATAIEKEINKDMGENIFVWNSRIIDEFMAK